MRFIKSWNYNSNPSPNLYVGIDWVLGCRTGENTHTSKHNNQEHNQRYVIVKSTRGCETRFVAVLTQAVQHTYLPGVQSCNSTFYFQRSEVVCSYPSPRKLQCISWHCTYYWHILTVLRPLPLAECLRCAFDMSSAGVCSLLLDNQAPNVQHSQPTMRLPLVPLCFLTIKYVFFGPSINVCFACAVISSATNDRNHPQLLDTPLVVYWGSWAVTWRCISTTAAFEGVIIGERWRCFRPSGGKWPRRGGSTPFYIF